MPRVGKGVENLDDAAARALTLLERQPRVAEQEFMTLLVRDPSTGLIFRHPFQTQGQRTTSSFKGFPDGDIVGVVHNHPTGRAGERFPNSLFSATDLRTASELGVPTFISAIQGNGQIAERRRTQARVGDRRADSPRAGEEFLAQIPIDLIFQLMARDANPLVASILLDRANANAPNQNPIQNAAAAAQGTEARSGNPNPR